MKANKLRVVIIKPSKYAPDGTVERFRRGFMPNSTLPHIQSMTPSTIGDTIVETIAVDEYVHTNLDYLSLIERRDHIRTLLALVGVQSHQFHRALDLAGHALRHSCMVIIGGPHVMTCDTSAAYGRGVSFALAEAELIWSEILQDAAGGQLQTHYGANTRWQNQLDTPVIRPPHRRELARYIMPMMGLYPARGCPFTCNFCSVIKISGQRVRSQKIETTLLSLYAAKKAGVKMIMFTSDNFNKYSGAEELLEEMIKARLGIKFFVQCDTQIARQEHLVTLLARAGCFQMFLGVESFRRETLVSVGKRQNHPESYLRIVEMCKEAGISSHFSNIIGFPEDGHDEVAHHIEQLRELGPDWASFYILCPIPGTGQYDDFLSRGLITELNLDRFDTTCLVWRHPRFDAEALRHLLYNSYRRFYGLDQIYRNLKCPSGNLKRSLSNALATVGTSLFNRVCAFRERHPMSGGIGRVSLSADRLLRPLRKRFFDFDLMPLPQSLPTPAGVR